MHQIMNCFGRADKQIRSLSVANYFQRLQRITKACRGHVATVKVGGVFSEPIRNSVFWWLSAALVGVADFVRAVRASEALSTLLYELLSSQTLLYSSDSSDTLTSEVVQWVSASELSLTSSDSSDMVRERWPQSANRICHHKVG